MDHTANGANSFRQQTEQKGSKLCEGAHFFLGTQNGQKHIWYSLLCTDCTNSRSLFGIGAYGHARQAAMAELSDSQPSGPTQSSPFNPGPPPPPQEGDLAARNAEEKFVWVRGQKEGADTARKTGFLGGCPLAVHAAKVVAGQAASG
jgi:hypothetical protein